MQPDQNPIYKNTELLAIYLVSFFTLIVISQHINITLKFKTVTLQLLGLCLNGEGLIGGY